MQNDYNSWVEFKATQNLMKKSSKDNDDVIFARETAKQLAITLAEKWSAKSDQKPDFDDYLELLKSIENLLPEKNRAIALSSIRQYFNDELEKINNSKNKNNYRKFILVENEFGNPVGLLKFIETAKKYAVYQKVLNAWFLSGYCQTYQVKKTIVEFNSTSAILFRENLSRNLVNKKCPYVKLEVLQSVVQAYQAGTGLVEPKNCCLCGSSKITGYNRYMLWPKGLKQPEEYRNYACERCKRLFSGEWFATFNVIDGKVANLSHDYARDFKKLERWSAPEKLDQ